MPTSTNAQRIAQVRLLLRDTDTVRPYWSDAEINSFFGEALANEHAWIPRKKETQSLAFGATNRTQDATLTGDPSAVVRALFGSATGRPLESRGYSEVRWLQETETLSGEAKIFGVLELGKNSHRVAVYPLSAQTIVIEERIYVAEEPTGGGTDFYEDMSFYEQFQVVRKVAYRMAQLMGWEDSQLAALGMVDQLFGEASLGLRSGFEAPSHEIDDVRSAIVSGGR